MMTLLDCTNLTAEGQKLLSNYILHSRPTFLARKSILPGTSFFTVAHNLIIYNDPTSVNIKYCVISNDPTDMLGEGAFSRTRRIIGIIEIDTKTSDITFQSSSDKAVRITNIKSAQARYHYNVVTLASAMFKANQPFPHIEMQDPIIRHPYQGRHVLFKMKAYAAMKAFPGKDLDYAIETFINSSPRPSSRDMIIAVILPLLKAYEIQIAKKGYAHRDIKPANIKFEIHRDGSSKVNFIDLDNCEKLGKVDSILGTPGFIAPEGLRQPLGFVTEARDVFSLGVTIISCINPNLNPENYLYEHNAIDFQPACRFSLDKITKLNCYDPTQLRDKHGKLYSFFSKVDDSALPWDLRIAYQQRITDLLKNMTSLSQFYRPSLAAVIKEFESIKFDLDNAVSQSTARRII